MTRFTRLPLALVALAGLILPAAASAKEYPPYIRVYRPRPVVIVRQPPPPPVYVMQPPPRPVVYEAPPPARDEAPSGLLGLGFRFSTTTLEGTKLNITDLENSAMPGFGITLRSMVSEHWGLELSVDYFQTADGDPNFAQHTIPIMLSPIFYFFPDSAINPYALFGVGVHFTMLDYFDGMFEHTMFEVAGHAGLGVQVKLGDRFAIHADARFLTIFKNIGESTAISNDCFRSEAGQYGLCEGLQNVDANDKVNIGGQFQVGATYFF
jgi:hypothetical protein